MSKDFVANSLDMRTFARLGARLAGDDALTKFGRLLAESAVDAGPESRVRWSAQGQARPVAGAADQIWLQLHAEVTVPLTCQRCLKPVRVDLLVDRAFRFVADEKTAETEDEAAEEDVLALARDFNLIHLIEDEFLMELPLVPRHEVCPVPVTMAAVDPDFEAAEAERPNPFAALAGLQRDKLN
ncbi:MAG: YceD family protein [Burkholderiales bacterium]|nr:YceD family protein [Burkholderiales bacterium]